MGVRLWTRRAAMLLAVALGPPVAPGWAATQVEPIARLTLEGGYDSNVKFNGSGGDQLARLSPELGLHLRDHTWNLGGFYGADLLFYQSMTPSRVLNQRGALTWDAELERRLQAHATFGATYAVDPVGLARVGIVGEGGEALISVGRARLSWRGDRLMTWSATFQERAAYFPEGGGAVDPNTADRGSAAFTPGVEAARRLSHRDEAGGAYRATFFHPFSSDLDSAMAHGLKAFWRREVARRMRLEVEAGPTLWLGSGEQSVLPEATATLYLEQRTGALRLMLGRTLGVGSTATAALNDAAEVGVVHRMGHRRRLRVAADGGIWRSSEVPSGDRPVTGFGGQAEIGWALQRDLEVAVAGTHFQLVDDPTPEKRRTTLGVKLAWRLTER